jgi:hypothetical protein
VPVQRSRAYWLGDHPRLATYPDTIVLGPALAIAGHYVTYEIRYSGRDLPDFTLIVRDLTSGKVRRRPKVLEEVATAQPDPGAGITDIRLTSHASVAWMIRNPYSDPVRYEVHKADRTTPGRLLDAGTDIVPGSLRLSGDRLRWTHGTSAHAATLR